MSAIATACTAVGGPAALAIAVGVSAPAVHQWTKASRPTPADRCPAIERATKGRVPCEDLRPDVCWHRVPDAKWPWHPQGRPLIDVARPASANTAEVRDAA